MKTTPPELLRALDSAWEPLIRKARDVYRRRVVASFVVLAAASVLCALLVLGRVAYTGSTFYLFLGWNLFLAWIPFLIAFALYHYRGRRAVWYVAGGALWLLFLPNAPYMITDLVHLRSESSAPVWFDATMISMFAWTGLLLGLISIRMLQSLVRQQLGKVVSWAFVLTVLTLSSFGIYLGRFQRWNSWDLLTDPVGLGYDIIHRLVHPFAHPQVYAVTLLFTAFLTLAYLMTSALPAMRFSAREREH